MIARNGAYLDYYKTVLDKVSFDERLFQKEYEKAARFLQPNELEDLKRWLYSKGINQTRKTEIEQQV
jgi:hypothetical protein